MSSSLVKRILTVVIGVPLVFGTIILFPQYNHLVYCIVIEVVTAIGIWELKRNLVDKKIKTSFLGYSGMLLPFVEWISLQYFPTINLTLFALATLIAIAFFEETLRGGNDDFKESLNRIASTALIICYPGLFMSYAMRIPFHPGHTTALIILFIGSVFASDIFAYITGMLLGRNNKGYVKCSPNKSIAGFIGGIVFPGLFAILLTIFLPKYFPYKKVNMLLVAIFTAIFGIIGDLFESMLKRACEVKDSGNIIPGRGGMLDCIDSISVAAPIFVLLCEELLC